MKQIIAALLLSFNFICAANIPGLFSDGANDEQRVTFRFDPQIRVHINAPSEQHFDANRPTALVLYALPNGNTIEQTAGKIVQPGDDWHFGIQHIAAQTRFLRRQIADYNLVVIYLEAAQKSWPAWKAAHENHARIIQQLTDYLLDVFSEYNPFLVLSGHSGGGRFIFSFLDGVEQIPPEVKRICFLDSDYGYEKHYGMQIANWLKSDSANSLCVLAYNDSVALYQGKTFVSPTGGTWYRSRKMQKEMSDIFQFATSEDTSLIRHRALDGRLQILLKKNPGRKVLHTVQVKRNGFIHSMLSGTIRDEKDYRYYGAPVYANQISRKSDVKSALRIPPRTGSMKTGSRFMDAVDTLPVSQRDSLLSKTIMSGNLPYFLRHLLSIDTVLTDAFGAEHRVQMAYMPDYLAVGSDSDFCRVPLGPAAAQRIADRFGAILPTRKIVDMIDRQCKIRIDPVTYWPVGDANEKVRQFVRHNREINAALIEAGWRPGMPAAGLKKDVVISNKIFDEDRPGHVVIYGWHRSNGKPIQPLTNIHTAKYMDYSHGIRLLNRRCVLDEKPADIADILQDAVLFRLLSDEKSPLKNPAYPGN